MNRRKYKTDTTEILANVTEFFHALQWSKSTKHRRKITAKYNDLQEYFQKMGDFVTYYALLGLTYEHMFGPFRKWRAKRILHKRLAEMGVTNEKAGKSEHS